MGKGNLLIVDDEPIILKRLKFNLEDYADEVFIAENGLQALERLKEQEIHCVICDINMPKMNGVEVIKTIRKEGNNVPFVFYTAHGNQELMMEAVKYGAFDFLNKPNLDGLEDVVSRGLKEGFDRKSGVEVAEDAYVSDYQKLLEQVENEEK
jgi:DNA-binding NtrC family response regulator